MLTRNLIKLNLAVLFLFINGLTAKAGLLDKTITISASNKPVIEVLHEIENSGELTFSFKSDLFDRDKIISIDVKEATIAEILNIIFEGQPVSYKEIGSQIVLFFDNEKQKQPEIKEVDVADNEQIREIIKNDTVYRYINTTRVKVYDTVRYVFFDTVRTKIKPPKPNISFELGFSPYINFSKISAQKPEFEDAAELVGNSTQDKFSYNLYGKFNTSIKNIKLSTGFIYSGFNESVKYSGSHLLTTTSYAIEAISGRKILDTTYTEFISGGGMGSGGRDTVKITKEYINDSVYTIVTKTTTENIELDTSGNNKYNYLSFPITVGWQKEINEKLIFTINGGPIIDVMVAKKGFMLNPANQFNFDDFDDIPFIKLNVSLLLNTGVYYKFHPNFAGTFQVNYFQQLQSIYSAGFPFKKQNNSIAFSVGCVYLL